MAALLSVEQARTAMLEGVVVPDLDQILIKHCWLLQHRAHLLCDANKNSLLTTKAYCNAKFLRQTLRR